MFAFVLLLVNAYVATLVKFVMGVCFLFSIQYTKTLCGTVLLMYLQFEFEYAW